MTGPKSDRSDRRCLHARVVGINLFRTTMSLKVVEQIASRQRFSYIESLKLGEEILAVDHGRLQDKAHGEVAETSSNEFGGELFVRTCRNADQGQLRSSCC